MKNPQKKKKEIIISKLKEFFNEKASQYKVDMAFLYGSWASGFPHIDSDIDLAAVFSSKIESDEDRFSLLTDISYSLSKILNPDVNVISVYKDFRHPMLYYNAIVLGIPIFIKNNEKFIDLKIEAISQMEDFSIFGISWQLEVAKKNLRG